MPDAGAPKLDVHEADLADATDAQAVVDLVDAYAREPIGGGKRLSKAVLEAMVPGLREHPTSLVFLARAAQQAVGVAVCFRGFSTFEARPLLNVHDLAVRADWRRRGVGRRLLEAVEARAVALGCCRLTLEAREDNGPARALYADFGFAAPAAHVDAALVRFLEKAL